MPHATVEWTDNLAGELAIGELLELIAATLRDSDGLFPIGGIRVRGVRLSDYVIADGQGEDAFVNIVFRIGGGRAPETLQRFFAALFERVKAFLAPVIAARPLALSLYVDEVDEGASYKFNTVHARLAGAA